MRRGSALASTPTAVASVGAAAAPSTHAGPLGIPRAFAAALPQGCRAATRRRRTAGNPWRTPPGCPRPATRTGILRGTGPAPGQSGSPGRSGSDAARRCPRRSPAGPGQPSRRGPAPAGTAPAGRASSSTATTGLPPHPGAPQQPSPSFLASLILQVFPQLIGGVVGLGAYDLTSRRPAGEAEDLM